MGSVAPVSSPAMASINLVCKIDYKPVSCPREELVNPSISVCLPRQCLLIVDHGDDTGHPASCYSHKPIVYPLPVLLHTLASNLHDTTDVSTATDSEDNVIVFLLDCRLSSDFHISLFFNPFTDSQDNESCLS